MSICGCMDDTLAALGTIGTFGKLHIAAVVAAAACLILSFVWSWWFLLGVVVAGVAAKWLATKMHSMWVYIGSVLLSMEVLSTDSCVGDRRVGIEATGNAIPQRRPPSSKERSGSITICRAAQISCRKHS